MRPADAGGKMCRASVSAMERRVSCARPDITRLREDRGTAANARCLTRAPAAASASRFAERAQRRRAADARLRRRRATLGRLPNLGRPATARACRAGSSRAPGAACAASQIPPPIPLLRGTVLCLAGLPATRGASDRHAVPSHRTELRVPRRCWGASDLDEYPSVFIDFSGGGGTRSLVWLDARLLDRRPGCSSASSWSPMRCPSPAGYHRLWAHRTYEAHWSRAAALRDLRLHGAAEQRLGLVQRPPQASPQRRRRGP